MTASTLTIRDLPDALPDDGRFAERPADRGSVFRHYDRVPTPIVDRPGDGVSSNSIRRHGAGAGPRLHGVNGQRPQPGRHGRVDGSRRPGGGGAAAVSRSGARARARSSTTLGVGSPRRRGHVPAARRGQLDPGRGGRAEEGFDRGELLADRLQLMPARSSTSYPPKIDWVTPTASRSPTGLLTSSSPPEVELLLSTAAR
jgi:hypothetical protein